VDANQKGNISAQSGQRTAVCQAKYAENDVGSSVGQRARSMKYIRYVLP